MRNGSLYRSVGYLPLEAPSFALWGILVLFQETATVSAPDQGTITALLGIVTTLLGAYGVMANGRMADFREALKEERKRVTAAEAREDTALGEVRSQGATVAELSLAVKAFATIAQDGAVASRTAAEEARKAVERLDRMERSQERVEAAINELRYGRGAAKPGV